MRTRRSPRNQERLFKDLFKPQVTPVEPVITPCCFNFAAIQVNKGGHELNVCSTVFWYMVQLAAPVSEASNENRDNDRVKADGEHSEPVAP